MSIACLAFGLSAPATPPPTLAPDGAWCWFGNPRALFKDGLLYFGYVRFADGRAGLNTYDPQSGVSSNLWLSGMVEKDDHDNPALLALQDGRLLAIYQKHGSEKKFYYRVSANANTTAATNWGPELQFTNTTAGMTYANPYQLAAESGKLYSFTRNLNFNPTWVTSDATGTNWSAPQILIKTGTGGSRPYVQYCSDFDRRIGVLYTDAHPGDAGTNCLYHIYYRDGALYQSDGTFLKYLTNAPLLHDSGERGTRIYQYSTEPSNDPNDRIQYGRAWCWDLVYHTNGAPVAAFSVQRTNVMGPNWYDDRIYYYYARWTGTNWQKRFIAHAGRPLYSTQRDYAGGISIDPSQPDVVYLASNAADPFNLVNLMNVPLRANDRYEVYRGVTTDGGLTFSWRQVTTNSIVDNLRPYVPRRNPYPVGVIWYAGAYTSYTSWNTAVFGLFATNLVPVTVIPNAAPVVSLTSPTASPLVLTNLDDSLQLAATATDDGNPGPLNISWTSTGPAPVAFASAASPSTSARFPQAGSYTLRLTASDTLLSSSVALGVLAGTVAPPASDPSLVAWYKFEEPDGATIVDSSGNANTGTLSGARLPNPGDGPTSGVLELNGTNNYVNIPDAANLDNTPALTLAFWMRAYSYTTGGAGLVSKRNAVSDNNAYTTFLQVDHLINVDLDSGNNRFTSVTAINTNTWYHLAVTFDGTQATNQRARLYVNGVLEKVAAESSPTIPNYNSSLKLGLTHTAVTTYLNGSLADVRIYRRALTDAEVASLAALSSAPSAVAGSAPAATNSLPASLAGAVDHALASRWTVASGPGTATFADSAQPATTVTFNAAGSYVLRLSAANAVATVFNELPVAVAANTNVFDDWVAQIFPGSTDPAVIGFGADPDADGAKNLLEFLLGMNPNGTDARPYSATGPGLPVGGIQVLGGTNYLTLSVKRVAGRLGVDSIAEVSSDLEHWSDALQTGPAVNNGDGTETVLYRDSVAVPSAQARYIRLRVWPR